MFQFASENHERGNKENRGRHIDPPVVAVRKNPCRKRWREHPCDIRGGKIEPADASGCRIPRETLHNDVKVKGDEVNERIAQDKEHDENLRVLERRESEERRELKREEDKRRAKVAD